MTEEEIDKGFFISDCCKKKIKLNPVEWSTPSHVKTWQPWCLECRKICKIERISKEEG